MPKPSRRKLAAQESGSPFPMMDRRLMDRSMAQIQQLLSEQNFSSLEEANAYIQKLMAEGGLPDPVPATPQEEAQELMYQAFDSHGKRRIDLARKALTLDPNCADAYVLLAEETARSPREALRLYRKGVEGAERALGSDFFEENTGHFWGLVETRPYMRALMGMAVALQAAGQRDDAISVWQRMLELNPQDNQGARDPLISALLREKRTDEALKLLDAYGDSAAASWAFSWALYQFQAEGPCPSAEKALRAAHKQNKYVAPYLVGEQVLGEMPNHYSLGGPEEASIYARESLSAWHSTTGVVRWICKTLGFEE